VLAAPVLGVPVLGEAFPQSSSVSQLPAIAQRMLAAQAHSGCVVY